MNHQNVKINANALLATQNFKEAFSCLEQLGCVDFISFLLKNDHLIYGSEASKYFWSTYITASSLFDEIFKSEDALSLLHYYFSKEKVVNQPFLIKLADKFPAQLISAIRVNKVFVGETHSRSLNLLKDHQNKYLRDHHFVFSKIGGLEKKVFNDFTFSIQNCENVKVIEAMNVASIWLEEKRALIFSHSDQLASPYDIHGKLEVIGFFLSYFLQQNHERIKQENITPGDETNNLYRLTRKGLENKEALIFHPVWISLDTVDGYLQLLSSAFGQYCFDLNFDLTDEVEDLVLKVIDENKNRNWHHGNNKLGLWYHSYQVNSSRSIEKALERNKEFLPKQLPFATSKEAAIRLNTARQICFDYSMDDTLMKGWLNDDVIKVVQGIKNHGYIYFVNVVDQYYAEDFNGWLFHLHKFVESSETNQNYVGPFSIYSENEMESIIRNVSGKEITKDQIQNILSLMTYQMPKKEIDRFKYPINLEANPFIKIGSFYFTMHGINGETHPLTSTLVGQLEKNSKLRTNEETYNMEQRVKEFFELAGFPNCVASLKYDDKEGLKGDFDIIVYEKGTLFLIELKRSQFRIQLSEIWNEYQNSFVHGSKQLEKGKKFIKKYFQDVKKDLLKKLNIEEENFENIKFHSMIVSTSFESDHEIIRNKHLKFSWFELLMQLEPAFREPGKYKLPEFIQKIINNDYWGPYLSQLPKKEIEGQFLKFSKN